MISISDTQSNRDKLLVHIDKMNTTMKNIIKIDLCDFPKRLNKTNTFEFMGEIFYYSSRDLKRKTRVKGLTLVYNLNTQNFIGVMPNNKIENWIEDFKRLYFKLSDWDIVSNFKEVNNIIK